MLFISFRRWGERHGEEEELRERMVGECYVVTARRRNGGQCQCRNFITAEVPLILRAEEDHGGPQCGG